MYSLNNTVEQHLTKGSCADFTWCRKRKPLASAPCSFEITALLSATSASPSLSGPFPRATHKNRAGDFQCYEEFFILKALLFVATASK